jgi:flagellar biogenesis protein FliO
MSGLADWLLRRLRKGERTKPRLVLVGRLSLTPRHSLILIEAEGRKLLVATAPEGSATFYALDEPASPSLHRPFPAPLGGYVC